MEIMSGRHLRHPCDIHRKLNISFILFGWRGCRHDKCVPMGCTWLSHICPGCVSVGCGGVWVWLLRGWGGAIGSLAIYLDDDGMPR